MKKIITISTLCLFLSIQGFGEPGNNQGCFGFSVGSEFLTYPTIQYFSLMISNNTFGMAYNSDFIVSYFLTENLKFHVGGNVEMSSRIMGFLTYFETGAGYEFRINDLFSIEPMLLAGFGKVLIFYRVPSPTIFVAKSLCKFNLIFNPWFKVYFYTGLRWINYLENYNAYIYAPFAVGITIGR